jgi:AcrR family transcriptional regulator
MAWDTERTRRRLKQAATEEFAAHGLHGTTMERIAARAGINKERLYNYFGGKQKLFALVLSDELAKAAAAVPITSLREEDIGEYAGRVFDYHAAHPQLLRLLHWEALAYGHQEIPDEQVRTAYYRTKVEAVASAQRDGTVAGQPDAGHLLFLVLSLSLWWFAVPQVARMMTGSDPDDPAERARRRAATVMAARRLAYSWNSQGNPPSAPVDEAGSG